MGNYNPHAPRIIGQEWVPIQEVDLTYSPSVNTVELGATFSLPTTKQVRDARFYVNQMQATPQFKQCGLVNIYAKGQEDLTGPIRQVIIPVSQVQITGAGTQFNGGATSGQQALYLPGDGLTIEIDYAVALRSIACWFDVNSYQQLLNGKRILNVSMLYSGLLQDAEFVNGVQRNAPFIDPDPSTPATTMDQRDDTGLGISFSGPSFLSNAGALSGLSTRGGSITPDASSEQTIAAFNLGDINNFWQAGSNPNLTNDRMPWRYEELRRFDPSFPNVNRQHIRIRAQLPITPWQAANPGSLLPLMILDYVALRVIFCEEVRIATGGRIFGYSFGAMPITLRGMSSYTADPILPAGDIAPTLSWVNPGSVDFGRASSGDFPKLNALRELYQIPSHIGTQVNVPFPLEDRLGETFTSVETHILPQLTLHASGGTLVEPHVYGRQAVAQVYGSITATQEIHDSLAGGAASWPWARYVARRFGDTTVPLTLTGAGQAVSITVPEFDVLDEILDGWKEVTLRFTTPPTMGAGTIPQFVWSAAGELAGSRWEVLGAAAPAVSGVVGSLLTPVISSQRLGVATYGQPVSGSSINLGWINGITPLVSATTDDFFSDAFLIFAQDMPTVTGFAVTVLTQPITGIGDQCGVDPCCIPNAILYNQLTWSPTSSSIPPSGFGYYELQRMDTVESDWQTIMMSTSTTGASFNDYEARAGILTSYRIRAVDVYLFPGLWSSTVSATMPAPGVSGGCLEGGHVLIFTSNERQTGSINLAYSSVWMDGQVTEDFVFPEAGFVQLQLMYNKDFYTAFRPLERGGERFSRTVLVQAAAIPAETLADFRSLRDMAWDTVNYICVRDEDGNRWFATVLVPGGRVLRDRRLYLAPVDIIEVTDTPTPVDPYA